MSKERLEELYTNHKLESRTALGLMGLALAAGGLAAAVHIRGHLTARQIDIPMPDASDLPAAKADELHLPDEPSGSS